MDLCWKDKHLKHTTSVCVGFPGGSDGKESACNARDPASLAGWGRSPGGGNGYLGNSRDRVVWQAIQSMGLQRGGCGWHFHFFCLCNSRCHVLQTCAWAESWRSFYSQSWKRDIKYFTTKTHRPRADTWERLSPGTRSFTLPNTDLFLCPHLSFLWIQTSQDYSFGRTRNLNVNVNVNSITHFPLRVSLDCS